MEGKRPSGWSLKLLIDHLCVSATITTEETGGEATATEAGAQLWRSLCKERVSD